MKQGLGLMSGLILAASFAAGQVGGGYGIGAGGGGGRGGGVGAPVEYQFQQAGTIGAVAGGRIGAQPAGGGLGTALIVGRPFSATEQRKSVQTLGDGTEISSSDTDLISRDSQGRTRTELQGPGGRTQVTITDPVSRYSITLNSINKIARRMSMPPIADETTGNRLAPVIAQIQARSNTVSPAPQASAGGGRGGGGSFGTVVYGRGGANRAVEEDLGAQSVNGVVATGKRSTLTIPQGAIGNNRDIQVVNERWYSEELQMLVKSVNSDPRFGVDTYELTDISRNEPDPSLFQVPPGYNIIDGGGRGGRGGAITQPDGPAQGGGQLQPAAPRPVIK